MPLLLILFGNQYGFESAILEPNRDDYDLTRLFETEMKAKKDRQMKGYNY